MIKDKTLIDSFIEAFEEVIIDGFIEVFQEVVTPEIDKLIETLIEIANDDERK